MAASLGQGGWSVRTCMLKIEPTHIFWIFGGFYASCEGGRGRKEGELQEIFQAFLRPGLERWHDLNEIDA